MTKYTSKDQTETLKRYCVYLAQKGQDTIFENFQKIKKKNLEKKIYCPIKAVHPSQCDNYFRLAENELHFTSKRYGYFVNLLYTSVLSVYFLHRTKNTKNRK